MNQSNFNARIKIGSQIGGYKLLQEVGRGSTGVVFLATQQQLDRQIALKILLPEVSEQQKVVDDFFQEARTAAKLTHPNIVQALDVGMADDVCFFSMEYVDGHSLEDIRIYHPELISLKFMIKLSCELADAMHYAWHNFKITHGDIKPGNLLIRNKDKCLKLADLGVAKVFNSGTNDEILATPMYASPEIIRGEASSGPRSDIYSFGIMFYELISGASPFDGTVEEVLRAQLDETPPPLMEVNSDIKPKLSDFVGRMIAKDVRERPADWLEVRNFFRQLQNESSKCDVDTYSISKTKNCKSEIIQPLFNWKSWFIVGIIIWLLTIIITVLITLAVVHSNS